MSPYVASRLVLLAAQILCIRHAHACGVCIASKCARKGPHTHIAYMAIRVAHSYFMCVCSLLPSVCHCFPVVAVLWPYCGHAYGTHAMTYSAAGCAYNILPAILSIAHACHLRAYRAVLKPRGRCVHTQGPTHVRYMCGGTLRSAAYVCARVLACLL